MWLMEGAGEPEYYSGRQMYNRIDQSAVVDVTQLRGKQSQRFIPRTFVIHRPVEK